MFPCFDDGSSILVIRESALRQVSSPLDHRHQRSVNAVEPRDELLLGDLQQRDQAKWRALRLISGEHLAILVSVELRAELVDLFVY